MNKICSKCNVSKELDKFWFNKKENQYHSNCKTCKYELSKKYNITPEKKAEYDKKYREKHKDELKIKKKEEYERNKDKYIERQKNYQQTSEGKLKHNIRTRINNAIKRKSNSTFELLGCNINFYIKYLEYFFDDKMSWENYGIYWQIDHIKPLKDFNLENEDEQKTACNWKNTRPLETKLNLAKKHNTIEEQIKHKEKINQFLIATSSN
jgi:hypothetical protein